MGYFDNDAGLLNSPEEIANAVQGVRELQKGQTPRVTGGAAIPAVSGLRVVSTALVGGNTVVTLSWFEPQGIYAGKIAGYNVYATGALANGSTPQLVSSGFSPAVVAIQATAVGTAVTFSVQTVMPNGQRSVLADSPTTAALTL